MHLKAGDTVGVVVTAKGDLHFTINKISLGVAWSNLLTGVFVTVKGDLQFTINKEKLDVTWRNLSKERCSRNDGG